MTTGYLVRDGRYAGMIAKANNTTGNAVLGIGAGPGLVTTLGAAAIDLIHLIPLNRSFFIRKIMWYHALGVTVTLIFGTLGGAGGAVLVPMFPTQIALTGIPGEMTEDELSGVEFMLNSQAVPAGWDGSLYVTSSVAGVLISAEVAEKL